MAKHTKQARLRQKILANLAMKEIKETSAGLFHKGIKIAERFTVEGEAVDENGSVTGIAISRKRRGKRHGRLVSMKALRSRAPLAAVLEELSMMTPVDGAQLKAIAVYVRALADLSRILAPTFDGLHRYHDEKGHAYNFAVLNGEVYGNAPYRVLPCPTTTSPYVQKGTLEEWKTDFAPLLKNNPLPIFVLCFGLSAPVAQACQFNRSSAMLCGESSTGKTLMAKYLKSLHGAPNDPHQWASTNDGLEALASEHHGLVLTIDELGSGDSTKVLAALYRLSSGVGKARANSNGALRAAVTMSASIFATGELSIWQQAAASGQTPRAGHEVRLPCIPVVEPFGVYTRVMPEAEDGAAFALKFKAAMERNHGVVLPALLRGMVEDIEKWVRAIAKYRQQVTKRILGTRAATTLTGIEQRVLDQFVNVALSGCIAVQLNVIPLTYREVCDAIKHVFHLWLTTYSEEQREPRAAALENVKAWVKLKAEGQLIPISDWQGHGRTNVVGFIKVIRGEKYFLIHRHFFAADLCRNHGVKITVQALREAKMLYTHNKTNLVFVRMPKAGNAGEDVVKKKMGFYAIRADILFDDPKGA